MFATGCSCGIADDVPGELRVRVTGTDASRLGKRVGRNVGVLTGFRVISTLAGFGSVVALARVTAPARFGEVAAAYGIVTFLVSVADLGGSTLVAREFARVLPSGVILRGVGFLRWMGCGSFVVAGLFTFAGAGSSAFLMQVGLGLCCYAPMMLWSGARIAGLLGKGKMGGSGFAQAAGNVVGFVLVLILVQSDASSRWFFVCLAVGTWFGGLSARFFGEVFRMRGAASGSHEGWVALKEGVPISIGGFAVQALGLDVVITNRVASADQAALIALPSRASNGLAILTTAVSQSVMVDIVSDPKRWSPSRLYRTTLILFAVMMGAAALIGVLGVLALGRLLPLLYPAGTPALMVVLLSSALSALTTPIGGAMVGLGRQRQLAVVASFSAVCGLVVTFVGAVALGATGAAFGRVAASLVVAVVLLRPANVHLLLDQSSTSANDESLSAEPT